MLQANPLEDLECAAPLLCGRDTEHFRHERDVLEDGAARNQLEVLEDETDTAAIFLDLATIECGQVLAVDKDLALTRSLLQEQQPEKRRFAGTARAGQKDEFSFLNGERQVTQSVQAAAIDLREVMRLDHVFVRIA